MRKPRSFVAMAASVAVLGLIASNPAQADRFDVCMSNCTKSQNPAHADSCDRAYGAFAIDGVNLDLYWPCEDQLRDTCQRTCARYLDDLGQPKRGGSYGNPRHWQREVLPSDWYKPGWGPGR